MSNKTVNKLESIFTSENQYVQGKITNNIFSHVVLLLGANRHSFILSSEFRKFTRCCVEVLNALDELMGNKPSNLEIRVHEAEEPEDEDYFAKLVEDELNES